MSGVVPTYEHQPSYEVVEAVTGGQLVEARSGGKIGVAAAGSTKWLGVASKDAVPEGTNQNNGSVVNLSPVGKYVTPWRDRFINVTFTSAANFGDRLVATANGQVGPAGATPDARTVVGYCAATGGVSAGAVGLAYIG